MKNGLDFLLNTLSPFKDTWPGQFSLSGQIFLHWAAVTLKGLSEFQNKKSRPLFTIIFKLKNDTFKTRDFTPLIKRVITGVRCVASLYTVKKCVMCLVQNKVCLVIVF